MKKTRGGEMELTIDEINNLTKNNDILMARNEELVKALEYIREVLTDEYYVDTVKAIHKIDEVLR
jgi:hypothetical protein